MAVWRQSPRKLSGEGWTAFVHCHGSFSGRGEAKISIFMGILSLISITMSVLTGERINFLIRACGGMLAAIVWKPNWKRYAILVLVEVLAIVAVFALMPSMQNRFTTQIVNHLPTGAA